MRWKSTFIWLRAIDSKFEHHRYQPSYEFEPYPTKGRQAFLPIERGTPSSPRIRCQDAMKFNQNPRSTMGFHHRQAGSPDRIFPPARQTLQWKHRCGAIRSPASDLYRKEEDLRL
jgi:hypothetical protein